MYHQNVQMLLKKIFLGIMDKPDSIYNVDETGFSKMDKREKVLTERSRKHTYERSVSSTCHITANICVSADGHVLPTFLIFENSFPSGSYRDGKLQTIYSQFKYIIYILKNYNIFAMNIYLKNQFK